MRVATVFAGTAAAVTAFGPAAEAAPDNIPPASPYTLWVNTSSKVISIQVCGYKDVGGGEWYCTKMVQNPHAGIDHSNYFGGNWKRGKVNVWEWVDNYIWASPPQYYVGHTCNTNGSYHGVFKSTPAAGFGVSLSAGSHVPLGGSPANC